MNEQPQLWRGEEVVLLLREQTLDRKSLPAQGGEE
jgi:hypothetical protein